MTTHSLTWNEQSVIKEALVSTAANGQQYALLHPSELALEHPENAEALATLQTDLFAKHHLLSYPKVIDGQPTLVVHGFNKEEKLTQALSQLGVTQGTAQSAKVDSLEDHPALKDRWDRFRHNGSLKMVGAIGMMGHVLMGLQGYIGESTRDEAGNITALNLRPDSKIAMAALFMVNCGLYAHYGNGDRAFEADPALREMREFLAVNNIDPAHTDLETLVDRYEKDRPFMERMDRFIAKNVILFGELAGIGCNLQMIGNGLMNGEMGMTSAGLASLVGAITATVVPEKPMSEQSPEKLKNPLGHAAALVEANPLGVLGAANLINSTAFFADVLDPKRAAEKGLMPATLNDEKGLHPIKDVVAQHQAEYEAAREKWNGTSYGTNDYNNAKKEFGKAEGKLKGSKQFEFYESDHGKDVWKIRGAMSSFYLASTLLMLVSSKESGKSDDPFKEYEEFMVRSAQIALETPAGKERDKAVELMGAHLANHPNMKGLKANEVVDYLKTEMDELQRNPFYAGASNAKTQAPTDIPVSSISTQEASLAAGQIAERQTAMAMV